MWTAGNRKSAGLALPVMALGLLAVTAAAQGGFDIEEQCNRDFQVGMEYWRSSQIPSAHEQFTNVKEACPDYIEAYYYKGRCEVGMKQYDEAIRTFKEGLDVEADHINIRQWMAYAQIQSGKAEDGIETYEGLLRDAPENIGYWTAMARAAYDVKRYPDAVMAGAQSVELRGDSLRLWKDLNAYMRSGGATIPALKASETIHLRDPEEVRTTSYIGRIYKDTERYARAIPMYEDIYSRVFPADGSEGIEYSAPRARDLWYYANVLKKTKQYEKSCEVLERVLEHERYASNSGLWLNLAFTYKDARRYTDGVRAGQKALEIDPNDCGARCALGKNYEGLGGEAERENQFDTAEQRFLDAKNQFETVVQLGTCKARWVKYAEGELGRMTQRLKIVRQKSQGTDSSPEAEF